MCWESKTQIAVMQETSLKFWTTCPVETLQVRSGKKQNIDEHSTALYPTHLGEETRR